MQKIFLQQDVESRRNGRQSYKTSQPTALFPPPKPSQYSRPMNKATEVRVPCSASNLSNNGVSAKILNNAWKNPMWINGKVLSRYTSYCLALWSLDTVPRTEDREEG